MIFRPPPNMVPIGAEWLNAMPQGPGWTPPQTPVQPIREIQFLPGQVQQVVQYLYAEIGRANLGQGTNTNQAVRNWVKVVGRANDDAGHIIGKNQGGLGTVNWNIFPQSSNFNRGVYAQAERTMYSMVQNSNMAVRIWLRFVYGNRIEPTRPTSFNFFIILPNGTTMHDSLLNP